jgi:uncharacterized protein YuzE
LIKYHKEDDALYIKLSSGKTIESEEFRDGFIVDFDKDDHIVGIEVLNVSKLENSQLIPLDGVDESSEKYNISFNRKSGKALFWKSSCKNSVCDMPVISFNLK